MLKILKEIFSFLCLTSLLFLSFAFGKDKNILVLDPKLKFLILDVLRKSDYIKSKKLELEAVKLEKKSVERQKGPTLSFSTSVSYKKNYLLKVKNWEANLPVSLSFILSYKLFDPSYNSKIKLNDLSYKTKEINYFKEKISLEYTFLNIYLDYLRLLDTLQIEKENLNLTKQIYSFAQKKYKLGFLSQDELINYLIFLKDKEKNIENLNYQIKEKIILLRSYLGKNDIPTIKLKTLPNMFDIPSQNLDKKLLLISISERNTKIELLKSKLKPSIDMDLSASSTKDFKQDISSAVSFSVGLSFNWLIFDNFQTKYQILKEDKEILSLKAQIKDVEKNFYTTLEKDKINILALKREYELQKRLVKLYKEIFKIKRHKFESGQISLEKLLDAQKNYLNARKLKLNLFYQIWEKYFNYLKDANIDLIKFLN